MRVVRGKKFRTFADGRPWLWAEFRGDLGERERALIVEADALTPKRGDLVDPWMRVLYLLADLGVKVELVRSDGARHEITPWRGAC